MVNVKVLAVLTVFMVIQTNHFGLATPCSTHQCPDGKTCRLKEVTCDTYPCPPAPVCVSTPPDQQKCGVGPGPVLGLNGEEIECGWDPAVCPDSTSCTNDLTGKFVVCCWVGY